MSPPSPVSLARRLVLVSVGLIIALSQVSRKAPPNPASAQANVHCDHALQNQSTSTPEIVDIPNSTSSPVATSPPTSNAPTATTPKNDEDDSNLKVKEPTGCREIMMRMQEWNDCWRRHVEVLKQQPKNGNLTLSNEPLLCPVSTGAGSVQMEEIGAPLYQWAFYQGQGFGRVLDHTSLACVTAFLLQRPCLVDISPRDPFYTFRSFFQENSYRWDPSVLHHISDYADQIEALAKALPQPGSGEWDAAKYQESNYDNDQTLIFPMQKTFDKKDWTQLIQYYHANNTKTPRRKNQLLFSPNWSNAWFTKIPKDLLINKYQCSHEALRTMLLNAMYGPTDLAQQLQDNRYYTAATSGKWNLSKDPTPPQRETQEAKVLRKATTAKTHPKEEEYGAIHLRMHFINEQRPEPIAKGDLVTIVRRCLKEASHAIGNDKFPKNWWLLSDNATMAVYTAEGMANRQKNQLERGSNNTNPLFSQSYPLINLYHNYELNENTNAKVLSSTHSNSASIRGKFGHQELSGAVEDWMALYSSKIAIVVWNGSFGTTGAKGNGKLARTLCGGEGGPSTVKDRYFEIYF